MLTISVKQQDFFDEVSGKFVEVPAQTVDLEHSLVSLSKWESIHEKPFLDNVERSDSEIYSYIQCMILSPEVSPEIVYRFSESDREKISEYIDSKQTATWFPNAKKSRSGEKVTSEVIYYWMVAFNIPFECQYWHLNRLLTLIQVCNIKNQPAKKMSKSELMRRNRDLNAQRRAQMGSTG